MDYKTNYENILNDEIENIEKEIKNFKKKGETDLISFQKLLDKKQEIKEKKENFEEKNEKIEIKQNIKFYIVVLEGILKDFNKRYVNKTEYNDLFDLFLNNEILKNIVDSDTKNIIYNIEDLIFDLFFYDYNSKNTIKVIDKNTINVYQDNEQVKSLYEVLDNKTLKINMFFYFLNEELNEGKLKYLTDIQKANEFYIIKFIDITDDKKKDKNLLTVSETENNKKCIIAINNKNMKILGEYKI